MPKIPTDTAAATTSRTRLLPFATRPNTSCMVSRRKKTRRKKTDGHGVERTRRWTSLEVERIPGIFFMSPAPSLRHFYRLQRLAKKWTNKFILHGYESAFSIWLFFFSFFIFYYIVLLDFLSSIMPRIGFFGTAIFGLGSLAETRQQACMGGSNMESSDPELVGDEQKQQIQCSQPLGCCRMMHNPVYIALIVLFQETRFSSIA